MTYYMKMQKASICAEANGQESKQDISEQCLAMAKVPHACSGACQACCVVLCYATLHSIVQCSAPCYVEPAPTVLSSAALY